MSGAPGCWRCDGWHARPLGSIHCPDYGYGTAWPPCMPIRRAAVAKAGRLSGDQAGRSFLGICADPVVDLPRQQAAGDHESGAPAAAGDKGRRPRPVPDGRMGARDLVPWPLQLDPEELAELQAPPRGAGG